MMSSALGQIGQNVADNLFEIGQGAVKGTVGVVADVASESIEQVMTAPSQANAQSTNKPENTGSNNQEKKAAENRRFQEVREELSLYLQRRRQLDQKIAQENAMKKEESDKKVFEKKKKDSFTASMLKKLGAGSHGETDKQKE